MLRNIKPWHYIIIFLFVLCIIFLQMYGSQKKARRVSNQLNAEVVQELMQTRTELQQYEEIQRIEQLQQDYKEQAMQVETYVNYLWKLHNDIQNSKKALFDTRQIDILYDYYTNQEDWYKVTIEEGNGVLYVEIEYFEVTTGSRSIPE